MSNLAEEFGALGEAVARDIGTKKADPKANFITSCKNDIAALEHGDDFGKQYKKRESGGFVVTLRNGIKVMEIIPGRPNFNVPDVSKAIALLQRAVAGAEKGEFDHIFAEQAKKKLAK